MKSYVTSYSGLFYRPAGDAPVVQRIEIPIIQRDYAQGRASNSVKRIRDDFLRALRDALTTATPISLDFIYGEVSDGRLRPLDGQQRLTTLFLLHWYLAWRANQLDKESGWKHFEYATRPSARRFCECLVKAKPSAGEKLSLWFEDQAWFLHTWRHDPTIRSMLVMLDAMDLTFAEVDCQAAWARLVDADAPGISFHLLPMEQMALSEDLYIKMNSRGRPLTPFENFKARFEQILDQSCPDRVEEFAQKIDGDWANVLWPLRGPDNLIDDRLLRYFRFVTEVCAWNDAQPENGIRRAGGDGEFEALAERVYGAKNDNAAEHVDFLIRSFDTWVNTDIDAWFASFFSHHSSKIDLSNTPKPVLFNTGLSTVNLFTVCCSGQAWPLQLTLLLYAILIHRIHDTQDFPRRLRVLRNLLEGSDNEIRRDKMPALLADVHHLVVVGVLDGIKTFSQAQVADEKRKADLLRMAPALEHSLFHLEDHRLLRGCLTAFDLEAETFEARASAFHALFADARLLVVLTGAMLAVCDYSQRVDYRRVQFASSVDLSQWRDKLLTGSSRAHLTSVRTALGRVLDTVASSDDNAQSALEAFTQDWLRSHDEASGLDWRWYFVRYPEMRAGISGIYASASGTLGYSVCMLDKKAMNSHYRDPYLTAIRQRSGVKTTDVGGSVTHLSGEPGFTRSETEARWMLLAKSRAAIQVVEGGLQLRAPNDPAHIEAFARVCDAHGIGADLMLRVPQVNVDGRQLDTKDRVQLGAALLRDLVGAGL